jgi:hypothetical protein
MNKNFFFFKVLLIQGSLMASDKEEKNFIMVGGKKIPITQSSFNGSKPSSATNGPSRMEASPSSGSSNGNKPSISFQYIPTTSGEKKPSTIKPENNKPVENKSIQESTNKKPTTEEVNQKPQPMANGNGNKAIENNQKKNINNPPMKDQESKIKPGSLNPSMAKPPLKTNGPVKNNLIKPNPNNKIIGNKPTPSAINPAKPMAAINQPKTTAPINNQPVNQVNQVNQAHNNNNIKDLLIGNHDHSNPQPIIPKPVEKKIINLGALVEEKFYAINDHHWTPLEKIYGPYIWKNEGLNFLEPQKIFIIKLILEQLWVWGEQKNYNDKSLFNGVWTQEKAYNTIGKLLLKVVFRDAFGQINGTFYNYWPWDIRKKIIVNETQDLLKNDQYEKTSLEKQRDHLLGEIPVINVEIIPMATKVLKKINKIFLTNFKTNDLIFKYICKIIKSHRDNTIQAMELWVLLMIDELGSSIYKNYFHGKGNDWTPSTMGFFLEQLKINNSLNRETLAKFDGFIGLLKVKKQSIIKYILQCKSLDSNVINGKGPWLLLFLIINDIGWGWIQNTSQGPKFQEVLNDIQIQEQKSMAEISGISNEDKTKAINKIKEDFQYKKIKVLFEMYNS